MTLKDKKLLITDLCARLPYGVYIEHTKSGFMGRLHNIDVFQIYNEDDTVKDYLCYTNFFGDEVCKIECFKPYLFPLSSMTKEQKKYITDRWGINEDFYFEIDPNWGKYFVDLGDAVDYINWLYKNHFDVYGLIEKGLALDATNLDIY